MNARKFGALIAAAAVSVSLFAVPAFAETNPPADTATATTTTTTTTTTTPDWLAGLKTQMDTIVQLRAQAADLEAKLKTQTATNKDLMQQLRDSMNAGIGQQVKDLRATLKQAHETTVKPMLEQLKQLEEQARQAKAAKDASQLLVLRAQISDLHKQVKDAEAKLKPQLDQLKQLEAQAKARHAAMTTLERQVKGLASQEKALYGKDQELNKAREAAWKAFEQALKADDHDGMKAALDTVITTKQQINANRQAILDLKLQITGLLQAALKAQSSSTAN